MTAVRVLLSAFERFPPGCEHDNVSRVTLGAVRAASLPGVTLERAVLPVEFGRAAGELRKRVRLFQPDVVLALGQGGEGLVLETAAYNLRHAAGRPDNAGRLCVEERIREGGPADRQLTFSDRAVAAMVDAARRRGERLGESRDPGRYVCNDVLYGLLEAVEGTAVQAGFLHLPRERSFPASARARWAELVEALVRGVVGELER
jgi:pyroglutamyl-peptidase